jgi:hypothetical protein
LPNSLIFLEKTVTAIQQIVAKASSTLAAENVSVNVVPYDSTAASEFYVVSSNPTNKQITIGVTNTTTNGWFSPTTTGNTFGLKAVFQKTGSETTTISFSSVDIDNLNGTIDWTNYTVSTSSSGCPYFTSVDANPQTNPKTAIISINNLVSLGTPSAPFALIDYNASIKSQNATSATIQWNGDPDLIYTSIKYSFSDNLGDDVLVTGTIDWSTTPVSIQTESC